MRLVLPFRRQVTSAVSLDAEQGSGLKAEEVKRRHILPKALIIGLVAGLISSAFREALQWSEVHRIAWLHRLPPAWGLLAALGGGAAGGGLGLWLVRRFAPEAAGSGIPQDRPGLRRASFPQSALASRGPLNDPRSRRLWKTLAPRRRYLPPHAVCWLQ